MVVSDDDDDYDYYLVAVVVVVVVVVGSSIGPGIIAGFPAPTCAYIHFLVYIYVLNIIMSTSPPRIDRGAAAPSRGLKLQVNHSSAAIMLHHAICVYLCVEHHHEYLTSAD